MTSPRFRRAAFLLPVLLALCVLPGVRPGHGEEEGVADEGPTAAGAGLTPESVAAADRGLTFLAARQLRSGAFGQDHSVAVTSLAGMAFMAGGHLPGRGRYGPNISRALRYLISSARRDGYITEAGGSQSRMHGHGLATQFLAELYGMADAVPGLEEAEFHRRVVRAVDAIERSQSTLGGWWYEPVPSSDEGSVTVCEVAALRAARNAGFAVRADTIDRAVVYLKRSANPDGSFKYSLSAGNVRSSFPLAAAAVSTLNYVGCYDTPEVEKGIRFLKKHKPGTSGNEANGYYYYANFYATLAMYQSGGEDWDDWWPRIREALLQRQNREDGSWSGSYSPEYCTAFAVLMLEIPYGYLPLFQR